MAKLTEIRRRFVWPIFISFSTNLYLSILSLYLLGEKLCICGFAVVLRKVRGLSQTISLISLVYGSFSSLFMKLREKCNQFSWCDVSIYCVLLSCPPSALIPRFVSLQRTIYKYTKKTLTTTKGWLWRKIVGCGVAMLLARLSAMNP